MLSQWNDAKTFANFNDRMLYNRRIRDKEVRVQIPSKIDLKSHSRSKRLPKKAVCSLGRLIKQLIFPIIGLSVHRLIRRYVPTLPFLATSKRQEMCCIYCTGVSYTGARASNPTRQLASCQKLLKPFISPLLRIMESILRPWHCAVPHTVYESRLGRHWVCNMMLLWKLGKVPLEQCW